MVNWVLYTEYEEFGKWTLITQAGRGSPTNEQLWLLIEKASLGSDKVGLWKTIQKDARWIQHSLLI